jgi:hypothetical protein
MAAATIVKKNKFLKDLIRKEKLWRKLRKEFFQLTVYLWKVFGYNIKIMKIEVTCVFIYSILK